MKYIIKKNNGIIPKTLNELTIIKDIGDYTAKAFLCFTYNKQIAIVDRNIVRFISRYYAINSHPDLRKNPEINRIANSILPSKSNIKAHNYGLLDFTGLICKAINPLCTKCPLKYKCKYIN